MWKLWFADSWNHLNFHCTVLCILPHCIWCWYRISAWKAVKCTHFFYPHQNVSFLLLCFWLVLELHERKKKSFPLYWLKKNKTKKNHTSTLHTFRYWFMCIYFSFFKHIFMCSIYTNILSVWESFGSLCFKDSASAVRKKSVFTILKGNCVNIFQHQWSWSAALLLLSHEGSLI